MFIKKMVKRIKKWLVFRDYHSTFFKFLISRLYRFALLLFGKSKKRKQSALEIMKQYLTDEELDNKKLVNKKYNDILFCRFIYGTVTREYFSFNFEYLSHEARKTYLTRNNKYPYYRKFNNSDYTDYLNYKTETYRKFKEFYKRDVLCLYDDNDYSRFVDFIKTHNRFIYKPADDYGGHGVEIYDINEYESIKDLFDLIIYNGPCVIEELIKQADPIASLHPDSVNTMRVVAFLSPSGETKIQWAFLRMGMGGSHTDNMSSGGLAVMVDEDTGIVYLPGRDWLGKDHLFHPDSGIKLVGFQIPEWEKLLDMVKKLSNVIPEIRLVGWDLAYTDKGWIFVEGNARPQCVSAQLTRFNGKLHLYDSMEEDYNKYYMGGEING